MKCEICGRGPMEIALFRVNEKGIKGVFRCKAHLTFEQEAAVDFEVKKIVEIIEHAST